MCNFLCDALRVAATSLARQKGAWKLVEDRMAYNDRVWKALGVKFPTVANPKNILILNSPTVLYGMDWMSGEHLQWGVTL